MALTRDDIDAIQAAFAAALQSSVGGGSPPSNPPSNPPSPPPDTDPPSPNPPSPPPDNSSSSSATFEENYSKAKLYTNELTGFLGLASTGLTEAAKSQMEVVDGLRKTFAEDIRPEIAEFRDIIGGISAAAVSGREELYGVGKAALEGYEEIIKLASGAEDAISGIELKSDYLEGQNAFALLFEDAEEAAKSFGDLLLTTEEMMPGMFRNMTMEMQRDTVAFKKALGLTDEVVTDLLKKQMAFTGEASNKIFEDISNVSVALSKETGIAQKSLQADIIAIKQDVENFGDIGVDAAGRIAASLGKLGLDFQTFQSMTSNFMNFDSAATKMGELSALFGIQMDAMEMTYLANEDREEFLIRMREQVLDAGLDVENMSNARARVLSQQMGMNVEQMKLFLRDGTDVLDQASLESATDQADNMDGMTTAVESIGRIEGVRRTDTEAITKNLQLQRTYTEGMRKEIGIAQESTAKMAGDFLKIKLPQESVEMAERMQSKFNQSLIDFEKNVISEEITLVNSALESVVKTFSENSEFFGGMSSKAEFDAGADKQISDITSKLQAEVVTELSKGNESIKTELAQATTAAINDAKSQNKQQYDEIISYVKDKQVHVEIKLDDKIMGQAIIDIAKNTQSSDGTTIATVNALD